MSLRQERLKWLSEQIHHECKEMKEVLDRFPIKQVKEYKRYNFDNSNTIKAKGKNMPVTDLIEYILTVYKRLRKISLYTTWRAEVRSTSALYKRGRTGIDYAQKTYDRVHRQIKEEFYKPLNEIMELSKSMAGSIKNLTIKESEEYEIMDRLTMEEYDGIKAEILYGLDNDNIALEDAEDALLTLYKENPNAFKAESENKYDALKYLYSEGVIGEEAYEEGVRTIKDEICAVMETEIVYDTQIDAALEDAVMDSICEDIERELFTEAWIGNITEDQREEELTRLREMRVGASNVEELLTNMGVVSESGGQGDIQRRKYEAMASTCEKKANQLTKRAEHAQNEKEKKKILAEAEKAKSDAEKYHALAAQYDTKAAGSKVAKDIAIARQAEKDYKSTKTAQGKKFLVSRADKQKAADAEKLRESSIGMAKSNLNAAKQIKSNVDAANVSDQHQADKKHAHEQFGLFGKKKYDAKQKFNEKITNRGEKPVNEETEDSENWSFFDDND